MKSIRRFLAVLLTLVLLTPVVSLAESGAQEIPEEEEFQPEESIPEDWETAEIEEEYWALSMWMSESEGTVHLYDLEDNPLELDEEMRFSGGTILETEEESLAAQRIRDLPDAAIPRIIDQFPWRAIHTAGHGIQNRDIFS